MSKETQAIIVGNEAVLVEYYDEHWYKIEKDGKIYWCPSVTTKLGVLDKPGLDRWRADVGWREAELRAHEAAQRGTRIHWGKETLLKGGAIIYDPWQRPIYTPERIKELEEKYGEVWICRNQDEMCQMEKIRKQLFLLSPDILAVELKVFDLDHRDAGTIDAVYSIQDGSYEVAGRIPLHLSNGIWIEDLKTGREIYDENWLQLAAYTYMFEKKNDVQIQGAMITHLGAQTKKGIPGLNTLVRDRRTLIEEDYPAYRHAAALWERQHKDDQPEMYQFPSLITINQEA